MTSYRCVIFVKESSYHIQLGVRACSLETVQPSADAKATALDEENPDAIHGDYIAKLKHNASIALFLLANGV